MKKNRKIVIPPPPNILSKKNMIAFTFTDSDKEINHLLNGMPGGTSSGIAGSDDFSIFIFKNFDGTGYITLSSNQKIMVNLV